MSNKKLIAKIKLALGQIGFYDENTDIYLTQQNPTANVYAGMNCVKLATGVKENKLILVEGSLAPSRVKQILKIKQYPFVSNDIQDTLVDESSSLSNEGCTLVDESVKVNNPVVEPEDVKVEAEAIASTEDVEEVTEEIVDENNDAPVAISVTVSYNDTELNIQDDNTLKMIKGESATVSVGSSDKAAFVSADTAVATVTKKGKITAKAAGETTIEVTVNDDIVSTIMINVTEE